MNNQQFCNNLVHYRQAAKMTQDDLASKLGVTPQAVSKWERGIGYPDLEIACAIAEFLHISLDQLLLEKARITESGKRTDSDKCPLSCLIQFYFKQVRHSFLICY